jgi:formylglycine-generating enzyme required for sulfatase activity
MPTFKRDCAYSTSSTSSNSWCQTHHRGHLISPSSFNIHSFFAMVWEWCSIWQVLSIHLFPNFSYNDHPLISQTCWCCIQLYNSSTDEWKKERICFLLTGQ